MATITTKKRSEMKDVFNGLSTLIYTPTVLDLAPSGGTIDIASITAMYEFPVTVDTLQLSQDNPTINHYKVIGLQGDWTSSSEAGDVNVEFKVPTKHNDVLKVAFGDAAVKDNVELTLTSAGTPIADGTYKGTSVVLEKNKIGGTIFLVDESKQNIMIVTNIALYATPLMDNPGTEPFALQFSGTLETDGKANFAWLKKTA